MPHFNSYLKPAEMDEILTPRQWNEIRIQLKQVHPELTDIDMPYYEARESDMLYMIECRLQNYQEEMAKTNHVTSTYQR